VTHRLIAFVASLLLISTAASAGPNWQSIDLAISPQNLPKVQAALNTLMKSLGADLKGGSVSLMANTAGGATSHSIITSFDSRAEREVWLQKLRASKAWAAYVQATAGMTEAGQTSRMNLVKNWGEENAGSNVFWEIHAFIVTDASALLAAVDALQASDAGKAMGAQVYVSEVSAAGISPITHLISVGNAGEAQAEASSAALVSTKAWQTYLDASRKVATHQGMFMLRTVATWGNAAE
jgi:hypothetical protein